MKKSVTLLMAMAAISAAPLYAADFEVLTTPQQILDNSIEDEAGAKAALEAALNDGDDTNDEAAAQAYMKVSTPMPGKAYDMSFLMPYSDINEENKGRYTQANLASVWKSDVEGMAFGADGVFQQMSDASLGLYLRVASDLLKGEASWNRMALYQDVELNKGAYQFEAKAWVVGLADGAVLAADETVSGGIKGKASAAVYSINFNVADARTMKLGFKRAEKAGALTQIAFQKMHLYKVSNIVVINDDATGPLAAAEGVDVQLNRSFEAGKYYPICLPFIVENWRDIFADVVVYNNLENNDGAYKLNFNTVSGANTMARKPYLVKFAENIDESNYLMFKGVTVTSGNAGSWNFQTDEEETLRKQMVFQGNWAAGTVPAGSYFLNAEGEWELSDGNAPLTAFSAYMTSTIADAPAKLTMVINNGVSTIVEGPFVNEGPVVVYNLQGIVVRQNADAANPLAELPKGIYVVNGKKVAK